MRKRVLRGGGVGSLPRRVAWVQTLVQTGGGEAAVDVGCGGAHGGVVDSRGSRCGSALPDNSTQHNIFRLLAPNY